MRFWAILCFAFATLTMAAAPALAAQAALPQSPMSQDCHDSGMIKDAVPSDAPKDMSQDMPKDMKACLALCMIAQGVMMPRANEPIATTREPLEQPAMTLSAQLHSLTAGIDPPPPRT